MPTFQAAFVTPGSFPIPSPTGSSVERVVEHIVPLLDRNRVAARIYGRTGRRLSRKGNINGIVCERYPAADKSRYVRAIARSLARSRSALIQVENRPQYALRLKRQLPKRRIWLNLHSATFIGPKYISRTTLRRSFACADRIIVNSEFLRGLVAAKVPEAAGKLSVVHLGVDTERFRSQHSPEGAHRRAALRQSRGWTGRKVVLYMGRVLPRKGVHHLLAILPQLVRAEPNVLLVIVGSPFYGSHRTTAYSRKLQRLGRAFPRHVRFVPYVSYDQVPNWFLAADMAVVPSGANEAFGLVNVEAMACGLPVVATRSGGMKEIVADGATGYLVDPARVEAELTDRIVRLLQDDVLRLRMGIASRQRVEQYFTWQHAADRWMSLFRRDFGS